MKVFNTLSGKLEQLAPHENNKIRMYVCGITPYDKSHLGHARTIVAFDIIRRYLIFRGYSVTYVQNITDIDDKIIKRAHERHVLPLELAKKYAEESEKEFEALGVMKPDAAPRVSESMPQIISLIKRIEKSGYAYKTESGVYFDVLKFKKYGLLSRQSLQQIKAGARVEVDEKKKNPQDFCLWKLGEEPGATFDSPWGRGRPGWHIECSAMSISRLGETIDIHGGARDLIFPHHENEIAQSEAATGKPFVRFWMHTGFLTVNGEKMAKSLGNFITIEEALKKYSPQQIRLFFALSHYRSPIDFSESAISSAGNSLATLHSAIHAAEAYSSNSKGKSGLLKEAEKARQEFISHMDNDFDTPRAMAVLFGLAKRISAACSEGSVPEGEAKESAATLEKLLAVCGLAPEKKKPEISEKEIAQLIEKRNEARRKKDFALADKIREQLALAGVVLEDRKDGTTAWRRK
ncbi:MAG: cysteine--tRNA ligase [Candidatus Micrarchaeota archaeon]|nr:cysteine--tRNA ligase [Candidatus Micrarchaeota archaeon]